MRLINSVPFTPLETEEFRQLIFANLIDGIRAIRRVMASCDIPTSDDMVVREVSLHSYPFHTKPTFFCLDTV